jgi:lipid-binding SYLF domain-containing protein
MKNAQRFILMAAALVFVLGIALNAEATFWKKKQTEAEKQKEVQQEKAYIRKMAQETLARLYKLRPRAQQAIAKSAGYGIFSNFGLKILVAGSGRGKGIVVDNIKKTETFMKMIEVQAGIGLGAKKFKLIWVFENHRDVDQFINAGWEFGGQASAAVKVGDQGGAFAGAMSVSPGIWLYQLTDEGIAIELTGKGTKYYKDKDLN